MRSSLVRYSAYCVFTMLISLFISEVGNAQTSNLENDSYFVIYFVSFVVYFLLFFVLGLGNIVVIFRNKADLLSSIFLLVVPVSGFLIVIFMAPNPIPTDYNFIWPNNNEEIRSITVITSIFTVFLLITAFKHSINSNGWMIGLVSFVFKISASLLSILSIFLFIFKLTDKKEKSLLFSDLRSFALSGGYLWLMTKLINGENVEARREESRRLKSQDDFIKAKQVQTTKDELDAIGQMSHMSQLTNVESVMTSIEVAPINSTKTVKSRLKNAASVIFKIWGYLFMLAFFGGLITGEHWWK